MIFVQLLDLAERGRPRPVQVRADALARQFCVTLKICGWRDAAVLVVALVVESVRYE